MKIAVTYEKKDILRLIENDLRAQRIKVKAGTALEYKGALQVKFVVETEDVPAPPTEPVVDAVPPPPHPAVKAEPVQDDDMSGILRSSRQISKAHPGRFETRSDGPQRPLSPNESYDFPEE